MEDCQERESRSPQKRRDPPNPKQQRTEKKKIEKH
jgi:hypothetical protein